MRNVVGPFQLYLNYDNYHHHHHQDDDHHNDEYDEEHLLKKGCVIFLLRRVLLPSQLLSPLLVSHLTIISVIMAMVVI